MTRFFALHVAVLPALAIGLVVAHLTVFRRHGVTTPAVTQGEGWFWPDQAFRDMLVGLLIFGFMLALVLWGHGQKIEPVEATRTSTAEQDGAALPSFYEHLAHAGRAGYGANLDAPADPARPYPARPEWYFLFLFQLLKYFEGQQEIVGTVVIPTVAGLLLAILPLCGYGRLRPLGHVLGVIVIVGLLASVAALTCLAVADDVLYPPARVVLLEVATRAIPAIAAVFLLQLGLLAVLGQRPLRRVVNAAGLLILTALVSGTSVLAYGAMKTDQKFAEYERNHEQEPFVPGPVVAWVESQLSPEEKVRRQSSEKFHEELDQADRLARRAVQLASTGILAEGALFLLRRDPLTRGKELFGKHCATCHSHGQDFHNAKPSASDLAGFASREWIRNLLRQPDSPHYFGNTKLRTMSNWIKKTRARATKDQEEPRLDADLDLIAGWLAGHPRRDPPSEQDKSPFADGYRAFADRCTQCHTYRETGGGDTRGPDFTGYGDADWVRVMIMAPFHRVRYGSRNSMPAFRDLEGPTREVTSQEVQQAREVLLKEQLLARMIKEDDPQAEELKKEIDAATKMVHLSDLDRELIIRWLVHDYHVVFGGEPISADRTESNSER